MKEFNRKAFIEVTSQYLASKLDTGLFPPRYLEVDERVVRYYHAQGILDKPIVSGREAKYNEQYVSQFVAIRLLQIRDNSIEQISRKIKDVESALHLGVALGINAQDIKLFVEQNVKIEEETEAEAMTAPQQIVEEVIVNVRKHIKTPSGKVEIKIKNQDEYSLIESNLKTGAAFAFMTALPEEVGKKLFKLIYGQKKKLEPIKDIVIPITEDEFELLGCTASGSAVLRDMAIIVADKDVYKEGNDVAQLFLFDPSAAGTTRKVAVTLDGAPIDTLEVKLDSNGCGVTRVATAASGSYKVTVDESEATCTFQAARYSLAPFVATLANLRKDDAALFATVEAMSFGAPFMGKAEITVLSNGVQVEQKSVEFHEGLATVQFKPQGEAAMSLRVSSKDDPDLIAGVPLPGTRQSEREDTVISSLGKQRTVSLIATQNSIQERGLHIAEGSLGNTPVILDEVISKKIELTFAADIEQLIVIVREPVLGTTQVHDIGSVKKGKGYKIEFASALASVHIGGLVNDKPWEGHAVVVQPSKLQISVKAPARLEPGQLLEIKIKTKEKASVLLRVADKRMRVQDSARTGTASMLKRWISAAIGSLKSGEVAEKNDGQCQCASCVAQRINMRARGMDRGIMRGAARGAGAQIMFAAAAPMAAPEFGAEEGFGFAAPEADMFVNRVSDVFDAKPMMMMDATKGGGTKGLKMKGMVELASFKGGFSGVSGARGVSGVSGYSGYSGSAQVAHSGVAVAAQPAVAREMEVDLIYSGLLEVNKEQVVKIQLPDTIGSYDITAFAVSNGDWAEAETSLMVEKEMYIEPMLPQYAHPEDGVAAVAVGVRAPKTKKYRITVDGSEEKAGSKIFTQEGENVRCTWNAVPGVHEIVMLDEDNNELDKVVRVVECPGEETVLGQELRILKAGEAYDIDGDDGAMSVKVLPGMQSELKLAVSVCTDFEHYCCEQTSSAVSAACVAAMVGDDSASKEQAFQAIIKGARRLKAMHKPGKGFASYPDREIVQEWSSAAARRVGNLGVLLESAKLPSETYAAIQSMIEMGKDVLAIKGVDHYNEHGRAGADNSQGDMEAIYYGRKNRAINSADVEKEIQGLTDKSGGGYWNYKPKSEAAFCAAVLFKNNQIDLGIKLANAVAKAMGGTLGGAFHGSYESLAYMHMVHGMQKAGIVPGLGSKIIVDGKEMTIEKALDLKSISKVKAPDKGACAIRITRLSKIRFDEMNAGVQLTLDVKDKHGSTKSFKAGAPVTLTVKLTSGYQMGDVLCVALPDALTRVIGGTKAKKFQLDFAGKNEITVDLVAGRATAAPQRWAAVVRNMYDGGRLGSVGLLRAEVK